MTMHWNKTENDIGLKVSETSHVLNVNSEKCERHMGVPSIPKENNRVFLKASVDRKKNQKVFICSYIFLTSLMTGIWVDTYV